MRTTLKKNTPDASPIEPKKEGGKRRGDDKLKRMISQLQDEKKQLLDRISVMKSETIAKEKRFERKFVEEKHRLETRNEDLEEKISSKEKQLELSRNEHKRNQEVISSLHNEKNQVEKKVTLLKNYEVHSKREKKELKDELEISRNENKRIEQSFRKQVNSLINMNESKKKELERKNYEKKQLREEMKKRSLIQKEIYEKNVELFKEYKMLSKSRIHDFLEDQQREEELRMNISQHFRVRFFVGFEHHIHNIIFSDSGRDKYFRDYILQVEDPTIDAYVETVVYDRKNDTLINDFLSQIERDFPNLNINKEMKRFRVPEEVFNRKEEEIGLEELLPENVIDYIHGFIERVSDFFGGPVSNYRTIKRKCDSFVRTEKPKRNIIMLGEFSGKGVCRHRSILFKIVCDLVGIRCSLQRGWIVEEKNPHCWTVVQLGEMFFQVDPMNSLCLIYGVNRKFYHSLSRNLDHTEAEFSDINMTNIERDFLAYVKENNRIEIGNGSFSRVYKIRTDLREEEEEEEKRGRKEMRMVRRNVAVKEYCTTYLSSTSGVNSLRAIRNEEFRLKLVSHPNVVKYFGGFSRVEEDNINNDDNNDEDSDDEDSDEGKKEYYCLAMEYLPKSARSFLKLMNKKKESKRMNTEEIFPEIMVLFVGVLNGLRYLHSLQIVHFDLHLENILLHWNKTKKQVEEVKIVDLGSCKERLGYGTTIPHCHPEIRSPEVVRMSLEETHLFKDNDDDDNNNNDKKKKTKKDRKFFTSSDIYSFGILMKKFERFYQGYSEIERIQKICVSEEPTERPSAGEILYVCLSHLKRIETSRIKKVKFGIEFLEREIKKLVERQEDLEEEEGESSDDEEEGT